jgi:leukotriene-A4 hydrolase
MYQLQTLSCDQYDLKPKHEVMGSALHILLPEGLKSGTSIDVKISYSTTKDCTALQWLDKEYHKPIHPTSISAYDG